MSKSHWVYFAMTYNTQVLISFMLTFTEIIHLINLRLHLSVEYYNPNPKVLYVICWIQTEYDLYMKSLLFSQSPLQDKVRKSFTFQILGGGKILCSQSSISSRNV